MRIKTFHAKSMSEALREIKSNLGPEALLLSTKEIPCRSGVWGGSSGFEVVAATDTSNDIGDFSSSQEMESFHLKDDYLDKSMEEYSDDGNSVDSYTPSILAQNSPAITEKPARSKKPRAKQQNAEAEKETDSGKENSAEQVLPFKGRISISLYQDLVGAGVDDWLAREIIVKALSNLSPGLRRSRIALVNSAARAAQDLGAAPAVKSEIPEKRVVAFVGPTGVGKTTSIAKLAAKLALQMKKKVILVTLDGYRIGAIEQLRTYAGLMGLPFRFVSHVSELPRAIEENSQRDYILVDSAGHGPKDLESMHDLASFLKKSDQVERHLVLSATTKPSDLRSLIDRFEICSPDHLLFTKLDETSTPGPILNELVRTHKSFSYYTDGQKVPDDLHAVAGESIIDIILCRNGGEFKEGL